MRAVGQQLLNRGRARKNRCPRDCAGNTPGRRARSPGRWPRESVPDRNAPPRCGSPDGPWAESRSRSCRESQAATCAACAESASRSWSARRRSGGSASAVPCGGRRSAALHRRSAGPDREIRRLSRAGGACRWRCRLCPRPVLRAPASISFADRKRESISMRTGNAAKRARKVS